MAHFATPISSISSKEQLPVESSRITALMKRVQFAQGGVRSFFDRFSAFVFSRTGRLLIIPNDLFSEKSGRDPSEYCVGILFLALLSVIEKTTAEKRSHPTCLPACLCELDVFHSLFTDVFRGAARSL